jgi:Tol biopolymer transport system component
VLVSAERSLDWNPVWSSDGYLYFVSDRNNGVMSGVMSPWRIAMDEETGEALGQAQLISVPARWTGYLSLSQDGKRLLYSTSETGTHIERTELDLERLAVTGAPRVVPGGSRIISQVRVSPDGSSLALADQSLSNQENLFLARAEGSGEPIQITRDEHRDRSPSWLPGGRLIFSSNRGGRYELWTVGSDGRAPRRLAVRSEEPLLHPVASPDGRRIACAVGLSGAGLIDASGRLEILPLVDGSPFSVSSWSPDGRYLAGIRSGRSGIFLYSLATRGYEKLSDTGWRPVWTADGTKVLFLDDGWKVAALDLATREKRELLAPPGSSYYVDMDLDTSRGVLYLARQQSEGDIVMSILE